MSGGGGKGGSTTTKVETEIPPWAEDAAIQNLDKAEDVAELDYIPHYGPSVAAMSPMSQAAGNNIRGAASAFGMDGGSSYLPEPQTFAGGVQGYSSGDLFDQSVSEFAERRPGQFAARNNLFIDPITGASPTPSAGDVGGGAAEPEHDPALVASLRRQAAQTTEGGSPTHAANSARRKLIEMGLY